MKNGVAAMRRERLLGLLAPAVVLAIITALGLPYALGRHLHVDEVQLVANTALMARGSHVFLNYLTPYAAAMSWFVRGLGSVEMYAVMRASSFAIFCSILAVLSLGQPHFRTPLTRALVLAFAALDYLLWSHGFELRTDIISLAGMVSLFALAHALFRGDTRARTLVAVGFVACVMENHSAKSIVFSVPAIMVIGFAGWPGLRARPLRFVGLIAGGAALGVLCTVSILFAAGVLEAYVGSRFAIVRFVATAARSTRFSPEPLLFHVARVAPITVAGAVIAAVLTAVDLLRRKVPLRSAAVVTHAFLGIVVLGVAINPTPFMYNAIYIAPFLIASSLELMARLPRRAAIAVAAVGFLATGWSFRYRMTSSRQTATTNAVQLSLIRTAEALTAKADPVLDGAGLVASREPPAVDWIMHSVLRGAYDAGLRESFASIMRRTAPPVVIVNYRWVWVHPEDWRTLKEMYVPISLHMRVLGGVAPEGASMTIHRAGRYLLNCQGQTRIAQLAHGPQAHECPTPLAYHWLGPTLMELPSIQPGGPSALFDSD